MVEIQIRLMRVEAMPEPRFCPRIPCPVGCLEVLKNNPRVVVAIRRVAPHVIVALGRARRGEAGLLKPRVLVGRVIQHEFRDDAEAAGVRRRDERLHLLQRAIARMDGEIVGDVVAIVPQGRGIERHDPQCRHAEFRKVVEPLHQPGEIPDAIAVAILKRLNVELVDNRVFEPKWVVHLIPIASPMSCGCVWFPWA